MSSELNNKGMESTAQETIKTIYHDVMTGSTEVGSRIKTIFDENSDQYLVIRDSEGRILVKLSLLGGVMLVAFSLFITRLRWLPLLAVGLSFVRVQMTLETDRSTTSHRSQTTR